MVRENSNHYNGNEEKCVHCYNLIIVGISFSVCIRFNLSSSVNECHQQEALLCIFDRQCEEGKKMSMYIPWRWFHFRMAAIFMYACEIGIKNTKKKGPKNQNCPLLSVCFIRLFVCVFFSHEREWVTSRIQNQTCIQIFDSNSFHFYREHNNFKRIKYLWCDQKRRMNREG